MQIKEGTQGIAGYTGMKMIRALTMVLAPGLLLGQSAREFKSHKTTEDYCRDNPSKRVSGESDWRRSGHSRKGGS